MPAKPIPQLGWMVRYTLGREAVRWITTRRATTGAQGTEPVLDQVCAAMIVGYTPPADAAGETLLNLKVQLDGEDVYWARGIPEGAPEHRDSWHWPAPSVPLPAPDPKGWLGMTPPVDPDILKAAAAVYYAKHPELDQAVPRSLEFAVRHPVGWSDDGVPGVEVIGHMDLPEPPGKGVPSTDT